MKNIKTTHSTMTKALLALGLFTAMAILPAQSQAQTCGVLSLVYCGNDNVGETASPSPAPAPSPTDDDCSSCETSID